MFYMVKRRFVSGLLEGLEHSGLTTVQFEVGDRVDTPAVGSSGYEIVDVRPATLDEMFNVRNEIIDQ